jgi:hypothetical protein
MLALAYVLGLELECLQVARLELEDLLVDLVPEVMLVQYSFFEYQKPCQLGLCPFL